MPRVDVAQNLVEHVAAVRMVPQVMMRIDNRQFGFERRFDHLREPRFSILFAVGHITRL